MEKILYSIILNTVTIVEHSVSLHLYKCLWLEHKSVSYRLHGHKELADVSY